MNILKMQSILVKFNIHPSFKGFEFTLLQPDVHYIPIAGLPKKADSTASVGIIIMADYKDQNNTIVVSFHTETKAIINILDSSNQNEVFETIINKAFEVHKTAFEAELQKKNLKAGKLQEPPASEKSRMVNILIAHFVEGF